MRKRISLEELELQLPKIELNETRFLLGGTGYSIETGNVESVEIPPDPDDPDDPDPNENDPVDDGNHGNDGSDPNDEGPDDDDGENSGDEGPNDEDQGPDGSGEYNDEEDPDYGDGEQGNEGDYNDDEDPNNDNSNGNNNNGSSNNGGGSAPDMPDMPQELTDGIGSENVEFNFDSALDLSDQNVLGFMSQFNGILDQNSTIANLIQQITANGGNLSFGLSDLTDPTSGDLAASTVPHFGSGDISITFDYSNIANGNWSTSSNPIGSGANITYDTSVESLVHTIIHELHHALISSMYMNAQSIAAGLPSPGINSIYDTLVSENGSDIANIYYTLDGLGNAILNSNADIAANQHDYFYNNSSSDNSYNEDVIGGVQEFLNDFQSYLDYVEDLQNWEEQMEAWEDEAEGNAPGGED